MAHPGLNACDRLEGDFDYIHFFAFTQAEMDHTFPKLKAHLGATGSRRRMRRHCDDPAMVHDSFQPEQVAVEISNYGDRCCINVRDDA